MVFKNLPHSKEGDSSLQTKDSRWRSIFPALFLVVVGSCAILYSFFSAQETSESHPSQMSVGDSSSTYTERDSLASQSSQTGRPSDLKVFNKNEIEKTAQAKDIRDNTQKDTQKMERAEPQGLAEKKQFSDETVDLNARSKKKSSESSLTPLSSEEILLKLQSQRRNFLKCYGSLLQKDPKAKGDMVLSFQIAPSGRVRSSQVEGPLQDKIFLTCLTDTLEQVRFPTFTGQALWAKFPLSFQ